VSSTGSKVRMSAEPESDGAALKADVAATHQLGRRLLALWPERPAPVGVTRVHDVPAVIPTRSGPALTACRLIRSTRGGMTELARPLCADVAAAITGNSTASLVRRCRHATLLRAERR
jgi:hypothetical protein